MTGASAWFPCYPNDLLGSIRWKRMTTAQRGAYWQLICWQMQSDDGHFDDDIGLLSALADLDLENGNAIVAEAFPVQENGRRANSRAYDEWAKRRAISNTRSKVGKVGSDKRWHGDSKPIAKAMAIGTTSTSTSTSRDPQQQQQEVDSPTPQADAGPPAITIPIIGGGEYPITQAMADEWESLYPAVDVMQTLREIRGWNLTNAKRRKTKNGVLKHVNAWLAREQNGGR